MSRQGLTHPAWRGAQSQCLPHDGMQSDLYSSSFFSTNELLVSRHQWKIFFFLSLSSLIELFVFRFSELFIPFLNWVMEISDTSARERRTNGILGWRIRHLRAGKETHPRRSSREMLLRSRIHLSDSTLLKCPGPSSKMGLICPSGVRFFFWRLSAAKLKDFSLILLSSLWRVVCVWGFQTSECRRSSRSRRS